jgi:RNA polymerase sigma-70 factor (ECF subfamily)
MTIPNPETWLDMHGDALYGYAVLRVREPALAEDLVQETLLAALSARERYKGEASERTWLVGILKNKLLDHLRRAGREQTYDPTVEDDGHFEAQFDSTGHWLSPPRVWSDPAFGAENGELRSVLFDCIGRLPERQRQVLVLRELDGMETNEMLGVLAISTPGNLWVMLSRARERVRACIELRWQGGGAHA